MCNNIKKDYKPIGPFSSVIGDVTIEKNVFVAANVVLRADEETIFYIGCNSNIQGGVILHGLKDAKYSVNGIGYSSLSVIKGRRCKYSIFFLAKKPHLLPKWRVK